MAYHLGLTAALKKMQQDQNRLAGVKSGGRRPLTLNPRNGGRTAPDRQGKTEGKTGGKRIETFERMDHFRNRVIQAVQGGVGPLVEFLLNSGEKLPQAKREVDAYLQRDSTARVVAEQYVSAKANHLLEQSAFEGLNDFCCILPPNLRKIAEEAREARKVANRPTESALKMLQEKFSS